MEMPDCKCEIRLKAIDIRELPDRSPAVQCMVCGRRWLLQIDDPLIGPKGPQKFSIVRELPCDDPGWASTSLG